MSTRFSALALVLGLALAPSTASADATLFVGSNTTDNRAMKGFAFGAGLLVVAFEFEYAGVGENALDAEPSLRTGVGNVLLQTPVAIGGFQPYFTTGGGIYRERLGEVGETNVTGNAGGGVKISIAGPLRLRVDYRVFTLHGAPTRDRIQRIYAGANVKF